MPITRRWQRDLDRQTLDVTPSVPIKWEGKETTLDELTQQEKMSLEVNADGVLEGGLPFDSMND